MLVSSSNAECCVSIDAEPDFLEYLRGELNANTHEVTALLGRWLLEYRPRTAYEIRVLQPHAAPVSAEASP